MIEISGNLFNPPLEKVDAICITTNGVVKKNGELVMGAGVAKQAANKVPALPKIWGNYVAVQGNHVYWYTTRKFFPIIPITFVSFPTKQDWRDKSDISLIKQSCLELVKLSDNMQWKKVLLTRPGCGLGGLNWEKEVKPVISELLDDRIHIIIPERTR